MFFQFNQLQCWYKVTKGGYCLQAGFGTWTPPRPADVACGNMAYLAAVCTVPQDGGCNICMSMNIKNICVKV